MKRIIYVSLLILLLVVCIVGVANAVEIPTSVKVKTYDHRVNLTYGSYSQNFDCLANQTSLFEFDTKYNLTREDCSKYIIQNVTAKCINSVNLTNDTMKRIQMYLGEFKINTTAYVVNQTNYTRSFMQLQTDISNCNNNVKAKDTLLAMKDAELVDVKKDMNILIYVLSFILVLMAIVVFFTGGGASFLRNRMFQQ